MKAFNDLSLLLAGAFISSLVAGLNLELIVIVSLPLLLFGIGGLEYAINLLTFLSKRYLHKRGSIAVLAPTEISNNTASWVNISLKEITAQLRIISGNIKRGYRLNDILDYPIILNPYGGAFPEDDLSTFPNLHAIISYVKNGGIYINIADIPFYYAYSSHRGTIVDTTPMIGGFNPLRSFFDTLLNKNIGIVALNTESLDQKVARAFVLGSGITNLYEREVNIPREGSDPIKGSPFISLAYGQGYFVFSSFQLDNNEESFLRLQEIIRTSLRLVKLTPARKLTFHYH